MTNVPKQLPPELPPEERALETGQWSIGRDEEIPLDRPVLMGVLNVTPDSFSDGGCFLDPAAAVDHALRLIDEGAAIIDIGGESTRPGAARVEAAKQIRRVAPVIERLHEARPDVAISIDTTRRMVAEAGLDAGARIINDVAAATEDESIADLAAERGCGLILMHRLRPPDADVYSHRYREKPVYDDVVRDVRDFLARRIDAVTARGIEHRRIVIDPGLGFGKTVEQNYELIARTGEFASLGRPLLSAASRKSFVGVASGVEGAARRVHGSLAVSVAHYLAGVRVFRVHDVAAHRETLGVAEAIVRASPNGA